MMKTGSKTAFVSVGLLCGLGFLLAACPASLDDRCAAGACVAGGGIEGGADVIDGGFDAPLDPCVDTPTDPKCLDDISALFVSAAAAATGADGTRARPFATIGAALAGVSEAKKRIYVCEGTYPEKVTVSVPVSILGGLACDWTKKGANPRIAPPKGVALSIVKSNGVVVTDFDVDGNADTQLAGDSAIAVFVSESKGVLFRRVVLKAGAGTNGKDGADGVDAPNYTGPVAPGGLGTVTTAGAAAPVCGTCVDGNFSTAGRGGTSGGAGASSGTAKPVVGTTNSGMAGEVMCGDGTPGTNGGAAPAAAGATVPGTLTPAGWVQGTATKGTNGNPAQGGGGGGATDALGSGSGGCGGCGGTGGGPGTNGGSSFALLSFESDTTIEDSTLMTANTGTGGTGGKGQAGQLRGGPGNGACAGGFGGHGAGGGGGGGGASGHSAPIAHSGTAPTTTNCMLKPGTAGALGGGGAGGMSTGNAGMPGNPGAIGSAIEKLPL